MKIKLFVILALCLIGCSGSHYNDPPVEPSSPPPTPFHMGSSKDEVTLAVGEPRSQKVTESGETWYIDDGDTGNNSTLLGFRLDEIYFNTQGKVSGWTNYSMSLNVKK